MAERQTKIEERSKAKGLTLEELEAQVGELLPDRLEMCSHQKNPICGAGKRREATRKLSRALFG